MLCCTGMLQVRRVDAEILAAVRQQSLSGNRAREDLAGAKCTIEELLGQVCGGERVPPAGQASQCCRCSTLCLLAIAAPLHSQYPSPLSHTHTHARTGTHTRAHTHTQVAEIRRRARQSELMVQEICRDIKKLDLNVRDLNLCPCIVCTCPTETPPHAPMQTSCSLRLSGTSTARRHTSWKLCSSWPSTSSRMRTSQRCVCGGVGGGGDGGVGGGGRQLSTRQCNILLQSSMLHALFVATARVALARHCHFSLPNSTTTAGILSCN
jgi:hypothetical protein